MSECKFLLCKRFAEKNGYCIFHRRFAEGEPRKKERVQIIRPVKKVAESRVEPNKEYKKIVKEKMKESNQCQLKIAGICTGTASGLHHLKKRSGKLLTDRRYLIRSCNSCNSWVEQHPKLAIEMGLSLSKF